MEKIFKFNSEVKKKKALIIFCIYKKNFLEIK